MKYPLLLNFLCALCLSFACIDPAFSQEDATLNDTLFIKDGSFIRCKIIELSPNKLVYQEEDGTQFDLERSELDYFVDNPPSWDMDSIAENMNQPVEKVVFFGYQGSFPSAPAGFFLSARIHENLGFIFDLKIGGGEAEGTFLENISIDQAENENGDQYEGLKESTLLYVNFGFTYQFIKGFRLYGSLGLHNTTQFRQYYDPSGRYGSDRYHISEGSNKINELNLALGAMYSFPFGMIVLAGVESQLDGVTLGVGMAF